MEDFIFVGGYCELKWQYALQVANLKSMNESVTEENIRVLGLDMGSMKFLCSNEYYYIFLYHDSGVCYNINIVNKEDNTFKEIVEL